MSHDDLDHIPPIVPTRDGTPPAGNARSRSGKSGNTPRASAQKRQAAGGAGPLARILITLSLAVAAVACAWAWQLQQALQESTVRAEDHARRISDLEARLSDTDQGMNQNAELQAAKIRELDSEVRKLWDNVWKEARKRLATLEKASSSQASKVATATANLATTRGQLKTATGDIARLKKLAADLEGVIASGKVNQAEVERVADTINRVSLDMAKLSKRVQGNEQWIQSINAFRKQVNATLVELRAALRSGAASPASP